jgi:hypothetical protein
MYNTFYDETCGYFKSTFILFFQVTKLIHLFILFFLHSLTFYLFEDILIGCHQILLVKMG